MSIMPSPAEDIPESPADHAEDVTAERGDPKETYAVFEAKHAAWKASPSDLTWHEFRRAYRDLASAVAEKDLDALWKSKHHPDLVALLEFGVERDRRYQKSPARKKTKGKYDRRNAGTEHRKEQCRAARQRYKERQRDKKAKKETTTSKTAVKRS